MIRKIRNSLTAKIFILVAVLLMAASGITYGVIAGFLPAYYSSQLEKNLDIVSREMADTIGSHEKIEDAFNAIELFEAGSQVSVVILDEQGNQVWPVPEAAVETSAGMQSQTGETVENEASVNQEILPENEAADDITGNVAMEAEDTIVIEQGAEEYFELGEIVEVEAYAGIPEEDSVRFNVGNMLYTVETTVKHYKLEVGDESYTMMVFGGMQPVNQAIEILHKIFPYILGIAIATAVLFAVLVSLYLTLPVVRLSRTSKNMAALNFEDRYQGRRTDEIGMLGNNLNELSANLSQTLGELQQANEKLKSDIEREREVERKRIEFFSAVSHELKTPITILKGHLDGMLQGIGEYRNREYYLERSRETAEKMERIVQELLTVSRIENQTFITKRTDIAEQLRQQLADMTELMEEKKIDLDVELPEHLYAQVNEPMIEKVFSNLLINAIRYTPENAGNQIRVILEETSRQSHTFVCSIENTGVFLPEETLPHLFEAFYRVEQSRNRQTGGSGLGLYIIKMVLDQHGAAYTMENTADGVRFTFAM